MAIFGWSDACVATHPSDVAVALSALDATVRVAGADGERTIPLTEFYRLPEEHPERETVLGRADLIVAIDVPASPIAERSTYLKVRERTSYEFALVSAAVGLDLDGERIRTARIALGGVAPKPWRLEAAEEALRGTALDPVSLHRAVDGAFAEAKPLVHNAFKVELAKRTVLRALATAAARS